MELHFNISFSIAGLFIAVVLFLVVSLYYSSSNLVNKRFKYFLISAIAMIALDIITAITDDYGSAVPVWLNIVLNTLYFFAGAMVAILFLYYCISVALRKDSPKVRFKFYAINLTMLGLYTVSLIVNGFLGFYFYFDATGAYTHGSLYIGVSLFPVLFVVESIVLFIVRHKRFNPRQILSTALFFASFFTSYALQLTLFPSVLLSDFGVALGCLLVFFSIESPDYIQLMVTLKELNNLKASLEMLVKERTAELDREKESYEELTLETLSSLASLIDAKDHYTNGHSFRVAAYAKALAEQLGLDQYESEQIYFAGLIHDVGKVAISESILTKPGKLSPEEFKIIQSHSSIGGDILKGIREFKIFEQVARSHHERYDGKGYPDGLKGEEIPYAARIVAVCDTFDAMTSDRVYRKALSDEVALKEIETFKGSQFDPEIADAFLALYRSYPNSLRDHVDEFALSVKTERS